jgi:hypothetical protein
MFSGEVLALITLLYAAQGGEIFLRLFEDVVPPAAFFPIDTYILLRREVPP